MQAEVEPLLKKYDCSKVSYLSNDFYMAHYKGVDLIITHSKIGKVFSSIISTILIERFKAEAIIFTGIAGAVNPELSLGDVVIASSTVQHDIDITAFNHPHGYIPGSNVHININNRFTDMAEKCTKVCGINYIKGVIATGDQFVNDDSKKDFIKSNFQADAIEMEGGSVNQVCSMYNIPLALIRSISDLANGNSALDYKQIEKLAINNALKITTAVVDEVVNETKCGNLNLQ